MFSLFFNISFLYYCFLIEEVDTSSNLNWLPSDGLQMISVAISGLSLVFMWAELFHSFFLFPHDKILKILSILVFCGVV